MFEDGDFRVMTAIRKIFFVLAPLVALSEVVLAKSHRNSPGVAISWKDVPASVQTTVQANAAGGKVKEVEKETANGVVVYCVEVKGTDGKWSKVYVNDSGAFMKVEPDNARNKRKHKPLFGW
jgi:hypothetical protein